MDHFQDRGRRRLPISKFGVVLVGFLALAGYLLWEEHEVDILTYLPLILFLGVCGGMHYFMHRSHRGGHQSDAPLREGRE